MKANKSCSPAEVARHTDMTRVYLVFDNPYPPPKFPPARPALGFAIVIFITLFFWIPIIAGFASAVR